MPQNSDPRPRCRPSVSREEAWAVYVQRNLMAALDYDSRGPA